MIKNKSFFWGLVVSPMALLGISVALASSVAVPHTFQPNTIARAAEVNLNFARVRDAINDNDARITAADARLDSGEARLAASEAPTPAQTAR